MDDAKEARRRRIARVAARIERALVGLPPEEQGVILAHLVSLWIAGHFVMEEFDKHPRPETADLRKSLVEAFKRTVFDMLPEAERSVLMTANAYATQSIH